MCGSFPAFDFSPCCSVYVIDSEHVKAEWNITIERAGFAIGNLEGGNSIQLKLFDTRRVSWMK